MDSLKKAVSSIKDRITKTPLERSVHEACTDENWGVPNTALHEIAEKTFNHEDRLIIMKNVWELLRSPSKEWRRLYKVLTLIEHLLKFGSTACMHEIQDEVYKIRMLQDFSFREGSEEKGIGIRDKSKYLANLLSDRRALEEEREKAKKTWSKFSGISSDNTHDRYSDYKNEGYDLYKGKSYESGYSKNSAQDYGAGFKAESERPEKNNDIFRAPEVKNTNVEPKVSAWDEKPNKLIPPPKPKSANVSAPQNTFNVFEVPSVKPASFSNNEVLNQGVPKSTNLFELNVGNPGQNLFANESAYKPAPANFGNQNNPPVVLQNVPISPLNPVYPVNPQVNPPNVTPLYGVNYSQNPPPMNFGLENIGLSFTPSPPVYPNSFPINNHPQNNVFLNNPPNTGYLPTSKSEPQNKSQTKIHANIGDHSGATIEQLKLYGKSGFSDFQSAPQSKAKEPVDLESKLFNLDDLNAGQPKAKEIAKSRW